MKFLISIILVLSFINCYSQNNLPVLIWEKTYGGSKAEELRSILPTSDNGYLLGGTTKSSDLDVQSGHNGKLDYWVVKIDGLGNIEWENTYGGSSDDWLESIQLSSDGGYLLAGYTQSNDLDVQSGHKGGLDYWVVKINNTGTIEWEKTYGGSLIEELYSVQSTSDGGYLLGGYTNSDDGDVNSGNKGFVDYWVVKITSTGTIEWEKTYGGGGHDFLYNIQQTSDGGYLLGGYTHSNDGDVQSGHNGGADYWVVKITSTGTIEWEKTYGGSDNEWVYSTQQTLDGGFILGGNTNSNDGDVQSGNNGSYDFWVVKITSTGIIEWEKTYGGSDFEFRFSIELISDGGYLIGGRTSSVDGDVKSGHNEVFADYWIVKINSLGTIKWEKTYGGSSQDELEHFQLTPSGGYLLGGTTWSDDGDVQSGRKGASDFWVIELEKEVLGIEQISEFIKIYPNPIENKPLNIEISFYDQLELLFMDIRGNIILTKELNKGSNQVDWKGISNGVYILKLMDNTNVVHQQKIVKK